MTFHVEGLERKQADNPYGYTEEQQADKKRVLREMEDLYPDVAPLWRDWVYDLCVNTPADELAEMKERIRQSKPKPPQGGVIHTRKNILE
jgi:hypothetical protein